MDHKVIKIYNLTLSKTFLWCFTHSKTWNENIFRKSFYSFEFHEFSMSQIMTTNVHLSRTGGSFWRFLQKKFRNLIWKKNSTKLMKFLKGIISRQALQVHIVKTDKWYQFSIQSGFVHTLAHNFFAYQGKYYLLSNLR